MSGEFRYLRCYSNGNNLYGADNHYCEVKVMEGTTNRAAGKTATGSVAIGNPAYITDGDTSSATYSQVGSGLQWIKIDLGALYTIDTVQIWHYWSDGRIYYDTKYQISKDGIAWTTIFDSAVDGTYAETSGGKSVTVSVDGGTMALEGSSTWVRSGITINRDIYTTVGSASWTIPSGVTEVEVLVVAGGGAGGLISNLAYTLSAGELAAGYVSLTVGGGGATATAGSNSTFGTLTAVGGGAGGAYSGGNGAAGGSGGGGAGKGSAPAGSGGAGTSGQGNTGGAGTVNGSFPAGGGGGGAGAAGALSTTNAGGAGGAGLDCGANFGADAGDNGFFAGGGGGGAWDGGNVVGIGGSGGGGGRPYANAGTVGINGTGGGGSGGIAGSTGKAGGSGTVIVQYGGGAPTSTGILFATII